MPRERRGNLNLVSNILINLRNSGLYFELEYRLEYCGKGCST